jgi:hypothetical protein
MVIALIFWYCLGKDLETASTLYRNGYTYCTGLSDHICVWQDKLIFKIKRKQRSGVAFYG